MTEGPKTGDDRPEQFGRYRVKKVLGRGGMGVVYLAEDPRIGREVAIKVIRFNPDTPVAVQAQLRRRFEVEAHSAGGLSHPNIVTIYDIGEQEDVSYIAMEFVRGESLESVLQSGRRLAPDEVADLVEQLCRALDFAHARGIVHRDIKPANILLAADGRPKIVDFGVAKLSAAIGEETRLTQMGSVIGTPAYMSPEQVTGQDATPRSDQFSLGVIVYEMLTGEVPFQGSGATTVMYKIVHEQPAKLTAAGRPLPDGIDEAVLRALAKDPADRYEYCAELAAELRGALRHTSARSDMTATAASGIDDVQVTLATAPATGVPEVPATAGSSSTRSRVPLVALGLVAVAAIVAVAAWMLAGAPADPTASVAGGAPAPEVPPATEPTGGQAAVSWLVSVEAETGAAIWVDGQDTGRVAPTEIELNGRIGDSVLLELRREGTIVQSGEVQLGPLMPRSWPAVATPEANVVAADDAGTAVSTPTEISGVAETDAIPLATRRLSITSRPPGAAVFLDDERLAQQTPAEVELEATRRYQLKVELPGYRVASWAFTLDDLNESQLTSGELHFPLVADTPPGRLRATATGYQVTLVIAGRRHGPASEHDIELPPGPYTVEIEAPEVFLTGTRSLEVASSEAVELPLPDAFDVQVAATPGNCRVSIAGRFVDVTPFRTRLVAGEHDFEFFWPTLDKTVTSRERITRADQRVFASAEGAAR